MSHIQGLILEDLESFAENKFSLISSLLDRSRCSLLYEKRNKEILGDLLNVVWQIHDRTRKGNTAILSSEYSG